MNMTEIQTRQIHYCTSAEAEALLKKSYVKGITYMVRCATFLYTELPLEDGVGGKGFSDMTTHLTVSQKDALLVAQGLLSKVLEDRGARLKIEVVDQYDIRFVHIG